MRLIIGSLIFINACSVTTEDSTRTQNSTVSAHDSNATNIDELSSPNEDHNKSATNIDKSNSVKHSVLGIWYGYKQHKDGSSSPEERRKYDFTETGKATYNYPNDESKQLGETQWKILDNDEFIVFNTTVTAKYKVVWASEKKFSLKYLDCIVAETNKSALPCIGYAMFFGSSVSTIHFERD